MDASGVCDAKRVADPTAKNNSQTCRSSAKQYRSSQAPPRNNLQQYKCDNFPHDKDAEPSKEKQHGAQQGFLPD